VSLKADAYNSGSLPMADLDTIFLLVSGYITFALLIYHHYHHHHPFAAINR
jgi:hypothetical protein